MAEKIILRWLGGDHDLPHRVRNFGEDVWGELDRAGLGRASLEEIDRSIDAFNIEIAKRNLGPATDLIHRLLKRHNLEQDVRIERA